MLLGIGIIADAHEKHLSGVLLHLLRVAALLDLVDGGAGGVVLLQLYHQGWLRDVLPRQEHDVGIPLGLRPSLLTLGRTQASLALLSLNRSLTRWQLPNHVVVVAGIVVGDADDAGERVLIVVLEDTGILGVQLLHVIRHVVGIAAERGTEQLFRPVEGLRHVFPSVLRNILFA